MFDRRQFMKSIPIVISISMLRSTHAANPMVSEQDPQAAILGYVSDTTKADTARYPKHTPAQHCGVCVLYQGGTAAFGGCPLYSGKDVASSGWCSAWASTA